MSDETTPEPERKVLEERTFSTGAPDGYRESATAPGVFISDKYQDWMLANIGKQRAGKNVGLPKNVAHIARLISPMFLPEFVQNGRKVDGPKRVQMFQAVRVAYYLDECGLVYDPEREKIRHVANPDASTPDDLGIHITRDKDGQWPAPAPEEFYDLEKIVMAQAPDGQWIASHPCGIGVKKASKGKAKTELMLQLVKLTEDAEQKIRAAVAAKLRGEG